jgi:hypothetical protein
VFPFEPPDRGDQQAELYEIIGFREDDRDTLYNPLYNEDIHNLFFNVMYNDELSMDDRITQSELLAQMLFDEYGLIFDDLWSWDEFREWYDIMT